MSLVVLREYLPIILNDLRPGRVRQFLLTTATTIRHGQFTNYQASKQASKQQNSPPNPTTHTRKNKTNISPLQLGTFSRGKRKVEDMQTVIAEARRIGTS